MRKVLQLKNLEALAFVSCDITATGLEGVESLTALTHVEFIDNTTNSPIKDLTSLSQLQNLQHLALSDVSKASSLSFPTIERLDLRSAQRLDAEQLLSIDLKNLRTIDFPIDPKEVGFSSVPSANLFPHLTGLKLTTPSLTANDIDKIKRFTALERLELVGCKDGIQKIQDLDTKALDLSLTDCSLINDGGSEPLDAIVNLKLRSLRLHGGVPQKFIERNIDKLVLISKKPMPIDLHLYASRDDPNSPSSLGIRALTTRVNPFTRGSTKAPVPFQPPDRSHDRFFDQGFHLGSEAFVFKTAGESRLRNVTIDFSQFLELGRLGDFDFSEGVTVMNQDRQMTKHVGFQIDQSLPWFELSGEELSQLLAADKNAVSLALVDPKLTVDDYSHITTSKLQIVSLAWSKVPSDWELILEQLLNTSIRLYVRMPDDSEHVKTKAKLSAQARGRLSFMPLPNRMRMRIR